MLLTVRVCVYICVYTLTTVLFVFVCSSTTVRPYRACSNTTVVTAAQPDLAPLTTKINGWCQLHRPRNIRVLTQCFCVC